MEARLGGMNKRMRRMIHFGIGVILIYAAMPFLSRLCGEIDYERVLRGSASLFAYQRYQLLDGGSKGYQGFGYILNRIHSIRMDSPLEGSEPHRLFDSGAVLRYQFRWLFPALIDTRYDRKHVSISRQ
ncbi:MAG: hypothetical protein V4710_21620 [Verrucomicrobiota bacterium]